MDQSSYLEFQMVIISQKLHLHLRLDVASTVQLRSAISHLVVCLWGMRDSFSQLGLSIWPSDQSEGFKVIRQRAVMFCLNIATTVLYFYTNYHANSDFNEDETGLYNLWINF